MRFKLSRVILCAVLVIALVTPLSAQDTDSIMQWEYSLFVYNPVTERIRFTQGDVLLLEVNDVTTFSAIDWLNDPRVGGAGWELVHWETEIMRVGNAEIQRLYFKRPRGQVSESTTIREPTQEASTVLSGDCILNRSGCPTPEPPTSAPPIETITQSEFTITLANASEVVELLILEGHSDSVNEIAFSPDGRTLVSGSNDNTVRLWDVGTGREIAVLRGHTRAVETVAFSPLGTVVASAGKDDTVRLWNVETGTLKAVFRGHTGQVRSLVFSLAGDMLASSGSDGQVILWDVLTGQVLSRVDVLWSSWSMDILPDNSGVVLGEDGFIRLWNLTSDTTSVFAEFESGQRVWDLDFNSSGTQLASAVEFKDGDLSIWDVRTQDRVAKLEGSGIGAFTSLAFSPDDTLLIVGDGFGIYVWDVAEKREIAVLRSVDSSLVLSVDYSPDGTLFATSSSGDNISLWGLPRG